MVPRSHALRGNLEAPRCGEHQVGVTIRIHDRPGIADILSAPGTTDISLALPAIG